MDRPLAHGLYDALIALARDLAAALVVFLDEGERVALLRGQTLDRRALHIGAIAVGLPFK